MPRWKFYFRLLLRVGVCVRAVRVVSRYSMLLIVLVGLRLADAHMLEQNCANPSPEVVEFRKPESRGLRFS